MNTDNLAMYVKLKQTAYYCGYHGDRTIAVTMVTYHNPCIAHVV